MSDSVETTSLGIEHYLFVLRRQWRVIAASTVVFAAAAAAALAIIPGTTTATTEININVISTEPFNAQKSSGSLLDDAAEARIAQSYAVAESAAEKLDGSMSAGEIRDAADVTTTSGTSVVTVSFTAATQKQAVRGADAVAAAYIEYRGQQADARIDVMLKNINSRVDELRDSLVDANSRAANAASGSVDASQAESDRQQISLELEDLLSQKNTLESVDTTGGAVLTSAENNAVSHAPSRSTTLLGSAVLGFAVGIVLAFVVNVRDRTLRSAAEMERLTREPVLARFGERDDRIPARGHAADQLRVARERVFARIGADATRLLIVDDSGDSDISSAAVNLAVVTAQAERRIRLFLPGVTSHQLTAIASSLGLADEDDAERVSEDDAAPRLLRSEDVPQLDLFVPTDIDDQRQSDLLITRQVRDAVADAEPGMLDIIVLSSAAHHSSLLAGFRLTDGFLVIARSGRSRGDRVAALIDEADSLGTPLLGSLMLPRSRR